MITEVKTKVKCHNAGLCNKPECMHYKEHDPVYHGEKPWQNCKEEETVCPLLGMVVQCKE